MRVVFVVLTGLVVALVAAVLVGPSFVDWNAYKGQISKAAFDATGRKLSIDGDISLSVLPSPKLLVKDVRLANIDGGSAPDMVQLKSLDVRLALAGLIAGKVQVQSVNLVDPTIRLEVLADGRRNWELSPPTKKGDSQAGKTIPLGGGASGGSNSSSSDVPDIRLDKFTLTNGTVVFSDATSGLEERLTDVNANLSARSVEGPFESSGSVVAKGMPLTFVVSVGQLIEGRTVPINATVQADAGKTKASVAGVVLDLNGDPRFKGKASLGGEDLAALLTDLTGGAQPSLVRQAFSVAGDVNATSEGGEFRDIVLGFGPIKGAANVNATFGEQLGIGAAVHFGHIDLDALLAVQSTVKEGIKSNNAEKATAKKTTSNAETKADTAPSDGGLSFPESIAASLSLNIDALTVNGGTISQARVNAEMVNGEITVSQALAQLPGSTDVAVFGFVTAEKGAPHFEGNLDASVGDTRAIARWLGVDLSSVPADRLRTLAVQAEVTAAPASVQAKAMKVSFDGSTLSGAVVANIGARPSVGADVTLDRINLDAYMVPSNGARAISKKAAQPATPSAKKSTGATATTSTAAAGIWKTLSALTRFDANVKAHVKQATVKGISVRDTVVDATLHNGALTVRRASVADAARAAINLSGTIKGLGGIPDVENLSLALTAKNPAALMKLAGQVPPPALKSVGPIKVAAQLNGAIVRPSLKATVDATGGQAGFDGTLNFLPIGGGLKGTVSLTHPNARTLLTMFGQGYRPAGQLGDMAVTGQLDATPEAVSLNGMEARIGKTTLAGNTRVTLGGVRPKIMSTLKGGEVNLTPFMPAARRADAGTQGYIPAAFSVPGRVGKARDFPRIAIRAAAASQRWPTNTLDLSALKSVDADIALTAKALVQGGYRLDDADVRLSLIDGVLTVSRLNGGLFGGALASSFSVDGAAPTKTKTQQTLSLKGVDLARLTQAATGKTSTTGKADIAAAVSASGASVADLMASLTGTGKAVMTGLDVRKGAKGSAMAPILDLFLGLNQLGGALTGGKSGTKADISASFNGVNGLFTSNDIKLSSGVGDGSGKAKIDLAGWRIEADGEVNMSRNVLGLLLSAKGNLPTRIPFSLSGPLDKPNVKIDSSLTKGGLPIPVPGIDKLLGKKGGALGGVLKGLLGGGTPTPKATSPQPLPSKSTTPPPSSNQGGLAPPPPPPGTAQPQSQPQKIDPRQLLKGLLGR